jgi:hypothetical protein
MGWNVGGWDLFREVDGGGEGKGHGGIFARGLEISDFHFFFTLFFVGGGEGVMPLSSMASRTSYSISCFGCVFDVGD